MAEFEYTEEEKAIVEEAQKILDFSCRCVFRTLRQAPDFPGDPLAMIFLICSKVRAGTEEAE